MMAQRSLFRRLLLGFVGMMTVIWLAALAVIMWRAHEEQSRAAASVNKGWTRQILLNACSVSSDPGQVRRIGAAVEKLRLDMFAEIGVEGPARTLIWQGPHLLYTTEPAFRAPAPLFTGRQRAEPGWVGWAEVDLPCGLSVQRFQKIGADWMFTPWAAGYMFMPLVYSLPFLLLPAWFAVRAGLRPLRAFAGAIEARQATDLSPLPPMPYKELSPLALAVNRLMQRLGERIAREQEFLGDAAHELKTPLSVIQINAHRLLAQAGPGANDSADGLRDGLARATHTVHQLLALERTRSNGATVLEMDLARFVRDQLALAAPLAMQKDIELVYDAPAALPWRAHRESLAALVDNIVGNAIKYSPRGGAVSVRLSAGAGAPLLAVSDQGPGIPQALRARVFERFYRVPGQDESGSGLGLAIAERAAARNGAVISLHDGPHGAGLEVRIAFTQPAAPITKE